MSNWQQFFDQHAPFYMQNSFTRDTSAEVDFLLEEFNLLPGSAILDVGCGTGRHSVELAKRGYSMTGIDLSSGMLGEAAKAAQAANVSVEWIQADATQFSVPRSFDAVICLCEGAFGLIGDQRDPLAHDRAILMNIYAALKPAGKFLLTALNSYRKIRALTQADIESGRFDPVTMIHEIDEELDLPEGKRRITYRERCYTPPELVSLLGNCGLIVDHVWGGTAGRWARRPIELDEIEMMIVAHRG